MVSNRRIIEGIEVSGEAGSLSLNALIDTGAEVSLIPMSVAVMIGALDTGQRSTVVGVHGDQQTCPVVIVNLTLPRLGLGPVQAILSASEKTNEAIIGMDIMAPLGIQADTGRQTVTVKNEVWEAVKTVTTVGVFLFGAAKLLGALVGSGQKQ